MPAFHPPIRLKSLLAKPGGIKVADALARAQKGVDSLLPQALAAIDLNIERLTDLISARESGSREQAYICANEIFADAGAAGFAELSAAAYGLCAMLGSSDAPPSEDLFALHVQTMRALRRPELSGDSAARQAVLDGLSQLTEKLLGRPDH